MTDCKQHEMGLSNADALDFYNKHGYVYCGLCGEKYSRI